MRIIAGQARGTRLLAPAGASVRPTSDRVREAVFSILGDRVAGAAFVDLYAGTGANGLEALSRGAASATLVERDRAVLAVARENAARCRLEARCRFVAAPLPRALNRLGGGPFDVVFADPPYREVDVAGLLAALADAKVVAGEGRVVIEHAASLALPEGTLPFAHQRTARYGDTAVSFFA